MTLPTDVLLDTMVVSFFAKSDPRKEAFAKEFSSFQAVRLCIAAQTLAELLRWPLEGGWAETHVRKHRQFISNFTILHTDRETCQIWAEIKAASRKHGKEAPKGDAWIAATAIRWGIPLATTDRKHFAGIARLRLIVPAPDNGSSLDSWDRE